MKQGLSRPWQNTHNIKINSIPLSSTVQESSQSASLIPGATGWWSLTWAPKSCVWSRKEGAQAPLGKRRGSRVWTGVSIPVTYYPHPLPTPSYSTLFKTTYGTISWLLCISTERFNEPLLQNEKETSQETGPPDVCLAKAYKAEGEKHLTWRQSMCTASYERWNAEISVHASPVFPKDKQDSAQCPKAAQYRVQPTKTENEELVSSPTASLNRSLSF